MPPQYVCGRIVRDGEALDADGVLDLMKSLS